MSHWLAENDINTVFQGSYWGRWCFSFRLLGQTALEMRSCTPDTSCIFNQSISSFSTSLSAFLSLYFSPSYFLFVAFHPLLLLISFHCHHFLLSPTVGALSWTALNLINWSCLSALRLSVPSVHAEPGIFYHLSLLFVFAVPSISLAAKLSLSSYCLSDLLHDIIKLYRARYSWLTKESDCLGLLCLNKQTNIVWLGITAKMPRWVFKPSWNQKLLFNTLA